MGGGAAKAGCGRSERCAVPAALSKGDLLTLAKKTVSMSGTISCSAPVVSITCGRQAGRREGRKKGAGRRGEGCAERGVDHPH